MPPDTTLETTLGSLARLALMHDARLILCDVLEPASLAARASPTHQRLFDLRARYATEMLQRLAARIGHQIECETTILHGDPFLMLTRYVMRRGVDLVVCASHRESRGRQAATASHLLRKCPAAVWLMGPRWQAQWSNIVVAVDRDIFDASDLPRSMASRLVEVAVAIARGGTATIRLVHAWEVYGAEWFDDPAAGLDRQEIERYIDAQRYSHTLWLEALHDYLREQLAAAAITHVHSESLLLDGAAGDLIPSWLQQQKPDLLVMGTLGSSGTPGLFIGNTAETIASRATVPLLALKPPGFRSPVAGSG